MRRPTLTRALFLVMIASTAAQAQTAGSAPGLCPAGTHAVMAGSAVDEINPDAGSETTTRCVADIAATSLMCGSHGRVVDTSVGAACGCDSGYAGDSCNVCATGFVQNAAGACQALPDNGDLVILGADDVVPFGGSTLLSAELLSAPGRLATGSWRLRGAPQDVGCLAPRDQPRVCLSEVDGSEVRYSPPSSGTHLITTEVFFVPTSGMSTQVDIKADMSGQIPINGWADGDTLPVINKLLDFMKARCIGAGSLGIAKNGKVVAALGLGMKDGRNAETIFNPACSSDATDPFKPAAGQMQYNTPFMFGSVSKATSFATARWAIKNALAEQDVDLRVISQSASRVVTAYRSVQGILRVSVWGVDSSGALAEQGWHAPDVVKDFQLVRMGDTRFVLITRSNENKLHVFAYSIDAAGQPKVTDVLWGATEVKEVLVTAIKDQRVVVGLRRANDTLQMRTFKLEANNKFTALDTENGGSLRDLSLVALPGTSRVIGAARLAYPDVTKLIVWDVSDSGTLTRVHETTLNSYFYDDARIQMAALSASRIVLGAQQNRAGPLSINVLSVAGNGGLGLVGATAIDDVHDFRVQSLTSDRFAIVASDANNNGTVQQFTLNAQGWPYRLGNRTNAGKFDALDLANTSTAGWGQGFVTAVRDDAKLMRLTSWIVGGTTLSKLKQATAVGKVEDYAWTDSDVESLKLVGFDFPNALLSKRLHNIVAGYEEPPMHFSTTDPRKPNNSCIAEFAPGYPKADARWKAIVLGDFFAHRAGLSGSAVAAETLIDDYLDEIRGLSTKGQWSAQEDRLREMWGDQNVKNARVAAGLTPVVNYNSPDGFLLPPITLEETLVGSASSCLPNPHGEYHYSNTDPQWLRLAMEHVTGKSYTAPVGKPEAVAGTLLNDFTKAELGFGSTGLDNIFARPAALNVQGKDPFGGPRARHWDNSIQGYYNSYWDVKRPICRWVNNTCAIANPKIGPTLDWNGKLQTVPLLMRSTGEGAATGSLGAQLLPHLKFMSKYWSGGYDSGAPYGTQNASIGEERNGVWTVEHTHDGGDNGTYARVIQFGSDCASGVDLLVSLNQWQDAQCNTADDSCKGDPLRYQELYNLLHGAACTIDWSKVTPVPWLNN